MFIINESKPKNNEEEILAENLLDKLNNSKKELFKEALESFFNEINKINLENLLSKTYVEVAYFLGLYHFNNNNNNNAIHFFQNSINKLSSNEMAAHLFYRNYKDVLVKNYYALANIYTSQTEYNNISKAEECFDKILFLNLSEIDLDYKEDTIYLYQYRKIDKYLFQDLIEKKLILNSVKNFNDPYDSLVFHWLEIGKKINENQITSMANSFNKIRIACFSGNFKKNIRFSKNILMWSHYADSHKGVCICYKVKKNFLNNFINENNEILKIGITKYKNNIILANEISINQSFLTKFNHWKYEKEVRLLYFNHNNKQDYISLEMGADVSIEQIYFGYKCSEQDKKTIKQLFPGICKEAIIDYSENKDIYSSIEFIDSK